MMLWAGGMLARPTYRGFQQSFADWTRVNGLDRRLYDLNRQGLLEKTRGRERSLSRVHNLTAKARQKLQPIDPDRQWQRTWDGKWRILIFDLPKSQNALRHRLWRFLRTSRFGYLQNSVWITPDTADLLGSLRNGTIDVATLTLLEARPCGGESDADLVAEAWNFPAINQLYKRYLSVLDSIPGPAAGIDTWRPWIQREHNAWTEVLDRDPFLPQALLPEGYLGKQAWERRQALLSAR